MSRNDTDGQRERHERGRHLTQSREDARAQRGLRFLASLRPCAFALKFPFAFVSWFFFIRVIRGQNPILCALRVSAVMLVSIRLHLCVLCVSVVNLILVFPGPRSCPTGLDGVPATWRPVQTNRCTLAGRAH